MIDLPPHPHTVAVAVSGGSDSMALVLMMRKWAQTFSPPIKIMPMIVNHDLRTESTQEAMWTHNQLIEWGEMSPMILKWHHGPISSGIMAKARQKRYELLALACHRLGIRFLFTAHHQDDILETSWMRQKRGSGPQGLAGLSSLTKRYGLVLIRPLLCHPKSTLQDILVTHKQKWIEDPSNKNPIFFRTHARIFLGSLSLSEKKSMIRAQKNMSERSEQQEKSLSTNHPVHEEKTYLHIPCTEYFSALTQEQGAVLLRSWLSFFTFSSHYTYRLICLWNHIVRDMSDKNLKKTGIITSGGGCLFFKEGKSLFIFRESGRLPPVHSQKTEHIWDSRWFCYGEKPVIPLNICHGPQKERLATSATPSNSASPHILYRPCSYPFPSFTTDLPWNLRHIASL